MSRSKWTNRARSECKTPIGPPTPTREWRTLPTLWLFSFARKPRHAFKTYQITWCLCVLHPIGRKSPHRVSQGPYIRPSLQFSSFSQVYSTSCSHKSCIPVRQRRWSKSSSYRPISQLGWTRTSSGCWGTHCFKRPFQVLVIHILSDYASSLGVCSAYTRNTTIAVPLVEEWFTCNWSLIEILFHYSACPINTTIVHFSLTSNITLSAIWYWFKPKIIP